MDYCSCQHPNGHGMHAGEDILMPLLTPLKTPASGVVLRSGFQMNYGNSLLIQLDKSHQNAEGKKMRPLLTLAHCETLYFDKGKHLERGEIFGLSGATGNTGGTPHCHIQCEEDGKFPRKPMRIKWVLT